MTDPLSSQLASLRIDRDVAAPVRSGRWRGAVIVAGLCALGAIAYPVASRSLQGRFLPIPIQTTEVGAVSPAQASVELTAAGYVVAQRISRVSSKVTGRVELLTVSQGDRVAAGQVLMRLDSLDERANVAILEARHQAALARAVSASASATASEAGWRETQQQLERERRLAADGVSAQGGADDLAARLLSLRRLTTAARKQAGAASAEAEVAKRELKAGEQFLTNLELRAPIAGIVLNKPPQPGEVVAPKALGVNADLGEISIADPQSLVLEADVPEQRLQTIALNAPAEIVLDAFPSKRYRGQTREVAPQINRSKATALVRVAFLDAVPEVLPDMAGRASFLRAPLEKSALDQPVKPVVPEDAVCERDGGKVVFIVEGDVVRMMGVRLGPSFANGFELLDGPPAGTQLVASPPDHLRDGYRIEKQL